MTGPGTWRRRSSIVLAAVLLALAGGGVFSSPVSATGSTTGTPPVQAPAGVPYRVTAAPTTVVDGQGVKVTVESSPAYPVYDIQIQLCRLNVAYQRGGYQATPEDFRDGGVNCPAKQISSNGDHHVIDSVQAVANAMQPGGETLVFHTGQGTTSWTASDGSTQTLSCDIGVPCGLVVEVLAGNFPAVSYDPWVFKIDYLDSNPLNSCGGAAPGVLRTSGGDRIQDAYINWTVDLCKRAGQHGAATTTSFTGDGDAMKSFSDGTVDLAYSGLGYHDDANLVPFDPSKPNGGHRNSIAVPIALNAAVVASGNGEVSQGKKVPYDEIKLTTQEASAMFAQGISGITPYVNDIQARNPTMRNIFSQAFGFQPAASAKAETTSWLATRYFARLTPTQWVVGGLGDLKPIWGQARSVDADLALADPTFNGILRTLSDLRGTVRKTLVTQPLDDTGGAWVLTDRETAEALDLTIAQLTNAQGDPVYPDGASMQAAVKTMTPDEYGILVPDPNMALGGGAALTAGAPSEPYPLTFVEYAIVPAEPLLDVECAPRTQSQELLKTWLDYLVGDGQKALPPGMEPLTPELVAQAHTAIAAVGTAASTRTNCPAPTPTTEPPPTIPDASFADSSGFGSGSSGFGDYSSTGGGSASSGAGASPAGTYGSPGASAATKTPAAPTAAPAAAPAGVPPDGALVPAFAGNRGPSGLAALVAFVVILALVSAAAFGTSHHLPSLRRPPARGGGRS